MDRMVDKMLCLNVVLIHLAEIKRSVKFCDPDPVLIF